MEVIDDKRFSIKISFFNFSFFPLFLIFSKNDLIFLFIIHILLSLSLWEFIRLNNFRDFLKKNKKKETFLLISRQKISSLDFLVIFKINILSLIFYYLNYFLIFLILIFFILYFYFILKFNFEKVLGIIYCSAPFFILINLRNDENYYEFIFYIFFFAILTDVFSYFSGKIIKGKKIFPLISAGKTFSGTIGGILVPCILLYFIFFNAYIFILFSSIFFSILFNSAIFLNHISKIVMLKIVIKLIWHGGF